MYNYIFNSLIYSGLDIKSSTYISVGVLCIIMLFFCWFSNYAAKKLITKFVYRLVIKSQNRWDDIFYENKAFGAFSHIAPALVVIFFVGEFPFWREFLYKFAMIYMTVIAYIAFERVVDSAECIYKNYEVSKEKPVTNYLQVLKIFGIIVCVIISIGIIVEKSPWTLLSGIGAMTAVLMVIFKDTIMGLSAGIQLSVNKMLHIGDWIEMPEYGADGEVIEITLNTVKVQNWDKSFTMIPVYCMISESFKNWRGMFMAGGRRIKRAIFIDMTSVHFCEEEELHKYTNKIIVDDGDSVGDTDNDSCGDNSVHSSFLRVTNMGIFRKYVYNYLKAHPDIDSSMYIMARQLQPSEYGLPLEIYAFCKKTEWAAYESVQARLIEHLIAAAPEFGLRIFQRPASFPG